MAAEAGTKSRRRQQFNKAKRSVLAGREQQGGGEQEAKSGVV